MSTEHDRRLATYTVLSAVDNKVQRWDRVVYNHCPLY